MGAPGVAFAADLGRLEVEEPSPGVEAPFVELGGWPDEADRGDAGADTDAQGGGDNQRYAPGGGAPRRRSPSAASGLRQALRRHARAAQRRGLALLQLLTCSVMVYFMEHLSPRNVIFLAMSGAVWLSAWLMLDPGAPAWALGLLYVLNASTRVGMLEPLWTAALALLAQCAFQLATGPARKACWYILGGLAVASELCWWPSAQHLIEADFRRWLVHFSTYYVVVIDFWLWPQLLQVDPTKWHITQEIEKAPEETQQAIIDVGAGLLVLFLLPLLACSLMAVIIIWRHNPRLCLSVLGVYISLVVLVVLFRNATPEHIVAIGQAPIALIFVILAREQLVNVFGDTVAWKFQAVLLGALLGLRYLLTNGVPLHQTNQFYAATVLVLQFASKVWLSAQCSAARLGLPSSFSLEAWAPRRSELLFGREEVHDRRVTLAR